MSYRHGTYAAYKRGCRCDPCAEYQRARVARSRAQRLAEGRISHGNPGWDDGCRCQICTRAHKRRYTEYRLRVMTK